ncbi:hypothetical protein QJQ45_020356 [Haematococcus lacustris]|nr:hypothetical protein QJQ45_020356 [Haematococcus lacustris]
MEAIRAAVASTLEAVSRHAGSEPGRVLILFALAALAVYTAVCFIADVVGTLSIPSLSVTTVASEAEDTITAPRYDPGKPADKDVVPCYDPGTMQLLGHVPAMSAAEVRAVIANAKSAAQGLAGFPPQHRVAATMSLHPPGASPPFPMLQTWRSSSFSQRRRLLRILLKFIIDHQDTICRVSARDSGKAKLDAILGEVVVTCEKIHWLCREGERWLRPEQRSAGRMSFYKAPRVEYHPVGVVGAIVPWNYPFHNVLNPLTAAVFAGNALVIKVSEYASWSTGYYGRAIQAALAAAGAPQHLVQFVTGYGEAGQALVTGGGPLPAWPEADPVTAVTAAAATGAAAAVLLLPTMTMLPVLLLLLLLLLLTLPVLPPTLLLKVKVMMKPLTSAWLPSGLGSAGGVDKLIFVGSTAVGRKVMAAAAETLTPVVLELGGKDAFIVCQDADVSQLSQVVQVACKAAFLNCGQNCAGGERFFVHKQVHEDYCRQVVEVVRRMRQGPALGPQVVDCGAMCMPGLAEKVQGLVDDAVARGATLLAGGKLPEGMAGQFYPPTVLSGVKPGMRIWEEEVFGPVMSIISWAEDDEVVALANNCAFGLGSNVFSGSQARARSLCARMEAGMTSINDFATTYMCQSLPFGGVKHSGFDRFAGIEGLRGLCVPKAVSEDRLPWLMKSSLPPPWQYPVQDIAFDFGTALVTMFYGPGLLYQIKELLRDETVDNTEIASRLDVLGEKLHQLSEEALEDMFDVNDEEKMNDYVAAWHERVALLSSGEAAEDPDLQGRVLSGMLRLFPVSVLQ